MRPYKRFREVLEDPAGRRLAAATVRVLNVDGTPATLYEDRDGTGGASGNIVYSNSSGEVSFYAEDAQYELQVEKVGYSTSLVRDITVGSGGRKANEGPQIDIRNAPYNAHPSMEDVSEIFQAAHDETLARDGFFSMLLPWDLPFARQINLSDTCNFEGVHMSLSGMSCVADEELGYFDGGSLIQRASTTGVQGGGRPKQTFMRFRRDGRGLDRYKGTGSITRATQDITGVAFSLPKAQPALDWLNAGLPLLIDAFGTDGEVLIDGKSGSGNGNYTLHMDKPAALSNGTKTALTFRLALTFTASSTANSKTLTITGTAAAIARLRRYMRVSGAAFSSEDDENNPGLSTFDRIQAFTVTGSTTAQITLRDGAANTAAGFRLVCWVETFGMEIMRPPSDGKDYAGLNLFYCEGRNFSGFIDRINGLDQIHWMDCKYDSCDRMGVSASGANDSFWERGGIGSTLFHCAAFRGGATPRYTGEAYLPYKDRQFCLLFSNLKEGSISVTDVNGPISLAGPANANPNEYPMVTLNVVNRKWFEANKSQDPTDEQSYLFVRNLIVNDIGGGSKWSQTLGSRPRYLVMGNGADKAIVNMWAQSMVLDPQDPRCPFGVELDPVGAPGVYTGALTDGTATVNLLLMNERGHMTMGEGTWTPVLSCVTNPESLQVTYTDQRGYWTRQPGGRVSLSVQLSGTITSLGDPAAAGNLRLGLPPGIVPRANFGGQRIAASVEGSGIALGADFIVNNVKVAEGGAISIWKTGPAKTPTEATVGNFPVGQAFTINIFGDLLV